MFYSVASPDWKPGQPLTPAGALLFRSKSEAESFAPEASVVAVAVHYNASTRLVSSHAHGTDADHWSSPAVSNNLGGIMVFSPIPAALLSESSGFPLTRGELVADGFHGWDSLTMALLA